MLSELKRAGFPVPEGKQGGRGPSPRPVTPSTDVDHCNWVFMDGGIHAVIRSPDIYADLVGKMLAHELGRHCCIRCDRTEQPDCVMRTRRVRPGSPARSAFAGFCFPPDVIVPAVRWYLRLASHTATSKSYSPSAASRSTMSLSTAGSCDSHRCWPRRQGPAGTWSGSLAGRRDVGESGWPLALRLPCD
jgi:hypothetical protein